MNQYFLDLSSEQWDFLSVLEAFGEPVSIKVVSALAPILSASFIDLLYKANRLNLIEKMGEHEYGLVSKMPTEIEDRLKTINTPDRFAKLADKISTSEFMDQISKTALIKIFTGARQNLRAAYIEKELSMEFLDKADYATAFHHLDRSLNYLLPLGEHSDCDALFISILLLYSDLSFALGKKLSVMADLLQKGLSVSKKHGDDRSHSMINLHIGRSLYFANQRNEALTSFENGVKEVNDIGDADILTQSAGFIGLYYYMQGLFPKAISYFENAIHQYYSDEYVSKEGKAIHSHMVPVFMGYCATYLGETNRAIGVLDCSWRLAMDRSQYALASTIRAVLGTILVVINKINEGGFHLERALRDAIDLKNDIAIYFARGGMAYKYFLEEKMKEAHNMLHSWVEGGYKSGLVRQYSSPWFLEMLYTLDKQGFPPIDKLDFHKELSRSLKEPSVHLQGIGLRIKSSTSIHSEDFSEKNVEAIRTDLETSEAYLLESGDPLQLAKTRIEMARLCLFLKDHETARLLAQKARIGLSGDMDAFFPDDIRFLIESKNPLLDNNILKDDFFTRFFNMMEHFISPSKTSIALRQVVTATNRFFGAERGALFLFMNNTPRLKAACNFTDYDLRHKHFKPYLNMIYRSFQENKPIIERQTKPRDKVLQSHAILCIPLKVKGGIKGVLYHDNSYVNDCFDFISMDNIKQLSHYIGKMIDNHLNDDMTDDQNHAFLSKSFIVCDSKDNDDFLTQDPHMIEILIKVNSMAESDAPILIMGETGVGKEVLARRLHKTSLRSKGPFVIVDATTIPENLAESELFGYEKGAFTGADRRKIGFVELAHNGTLFIDEIGELPVAMQVKLLRVLQDKSFTRIGGTQLTSSHFRLISATNRDLEAEIKEGNFRRDLYHRINTMPVSIPPLRKRPKDIILLAEHFITMLALKNNKPICKLNENQKYQLSRYSWDGNVRELKNIIERSVILSKDGTLDISLPMTSETVSANPFDNYPSMEAIERLYISHVLKRTKNKLSGPGGATEILKMNRSTLKNRMKKLGMK